MELKDQIIKLQKIINKEIDSLNWGGCIQFAYYFSNRLKELNISHKVYLTESYSKINNTYKNFEQVSHVVVFIENIGFIDGYKTLDSIKDKYRYYRHTNLNLHKLRMHSEWNNMYDTDQNSKLEQIIKNNLM